MLTGNASADSLIIAAAIIAACSTIYYKAIRPMWRAQRRLRAFFDKVENVFDMETDLPLEVRTSLLATSARLVEGHQQIMSELVRTNDRIDAHMDAEEHSLGALADTIDRIDSTLAERTSVLLDMQESLTETQRTVSEHLALDEQRFGEAHDALAAGQGELVRRLNVIEVAVTPKGKP